ncbi:hypothetical protein QFC24_005254 [Naganishia onofrii]|uniref:Uncharacterized protein n=1 Tax=Naganishia onofrii TaxID=1851511 RepID=A0ACC2XA86_9TREE|nr:hypothetical protein QFC24_005254 [Naganishia onofrii]
MHNGHPSDTPMIAFDKYLMLASLEKYGTYQSIGDDAPAQWLAAKSSEAFADALVTKYSVPEEKDAETWTEQRQNPTQNLNRLQQTVMKVKQNFIRPLAPTEKRDICYE